MSVPDPLTDAAAALLRTADPQPRPPSDNERMRAIIAMEDARDRERRHRLARFVVPCVAAAGLVLAVGTWRYVSRHSAAGAPEAAHADAVNGTPVLVRDAKEVPLTGTTAIRAGDRLLTTDSVAAVTLTTGTRVTIDRASDVGVLSNAQTQSFFLAAGSLHARVQKLGAGDRFLVRTTDAEIEVHGTSFRVLRVAPDPTCSPSTTRVVVEEGVVMVRAFGSESSVRAGQSWPAGCAPASPPPAVTVTPKPTAEPPLPAVAPSAPKSAVAPKPSAGPTSSELAEQNDLFGSAMAAKRAGDARGAVAKLERLLAKYPGAALTEQATVERFKLLSLYDGKRAREAAAAYLTRYTKGYARLEARALIDKP